MERAGRRGGLVYGLDGVCREAEERVLKGRGREQGRSFLYYLLLLLLVVGRMLPTGSSFALAVGSG